MQEKYKRMPRPPIAVLDEHPNWLDPLYTAFEARGVPYRKIDISASSYDPQSADVLPFYINRLSPSAAKRGHQAALSYALNYILYLESLGVRVVNGSRTVLLETSKAHQASLLRQLGIPHPPSIVLNDLSQAEKYLGEFPFPVVIKPNCGGSGAGIQKFSTPDQLREAITTQTIQVPADQLVLLQQFIQPKDDYIVRVETIGGKVIYAMKVLTVGTFNLCPSETCDLQREEPSAARATDVPDYCPASAASGVTFELYTHLPQEVIRAVEKIVEAAGLECGGVEYVVDHTGQWYIYDINALSILRASFKEEYSIDGWGQVADFFIAEYSKVVEEPILWKTSAYGI
jgi:hypothetical protein